MFEASDDWPAPAEETEVTFEFEFAPCGMCGLFATQIECDLVCPLCRVTFEIELKPTPAPRPTVPLDVAAAIDDGRELERAVDLALAIACLKKGGAKASR